MPAWSRRDYEVVAAILRATPMTRDERQQLSENFKQVFRRDNPSFDGARFDTAVHEGPAFRPTFRLRTVGKPRWSQKDYEMVAGVLTRTQEISDEAKLDAAFQFAALFGEDNPNFKVLRFFHAAGIPITAKEAADKLFLRSMSPRRRPGLPRTLAPVRVGRHLRRRK